MFLHNAPALDSRHGSNFAEAASGHLHRPGCSLPKVNITHTAANLYHYLHQTKEWNKCSLSHAKDQLKSLCLCEWMYGCECFLFVHILYVCVYTCREHANRKNIIRSELIFGFLMLYKERGTIKREKH